MFNLIDYIRNAFRYGNTLVQLVVINVVVYLFMVLVGVGFAATGFTYIEGFNAITDWVELKASFYKFILKPWGLLTYAFSHGINPFHLLFDMLFFYWMGYVVQEYIGSRKLLNIYIIGAIFAGLIYIACYAISITIGAKLVTIQPSLVGASAAIFAVSFAAITLVPEFEMMLFGVIPTKIKYLVWFYLIVTFVKYDAGHFQIGGGISHVAGALIGYLYIKLLRNGTDLGGPLEAIGEWWSSLRSPKTPPKVSRRRFAETTHGSARGSSAILEDPEYFPNEAEVDALLDKINNSGYESLTKEEKQKLFRASQKKD